MIRDYRDDHHRDLATSNRLKPRKVAANHEPGGDDEQETDQAGDQAGLDEGEGDRVPA